jgi:hypothetical protein
MSDSLTKNFGKVILTGKAEGHDITLPQLVGA